MTYYPSVPVPEWAGISHEKKREYDGVVKGSYIAEDRRNSQMVGVLRYEVHEGVVKIDYVGVTAGHRRQGLAAAMVQVLHHDYPDCLVDPARTTPHGEDLKQYLLSIEGVEELAVPGVTEPKEYPSSEWNWLCAIMDVREMPA